MLADQEYSDPHGWEARMAARARGRRVKADDEFADNYRRWREAERRQVLRTWTLGEAAERDRWMEEAGGFACACIGPPRCCIDVAEASQALKGYATYAARLMVARMEQMR